MDEKLCTECGSLKPHSAFTLKRNKPISICKECRYKKDKLYREQNKDRIKERAAEYWKSIKGTEAQSIKNVRKCATYRKKNSTLFCHYAAKYRASKLQATPKWVDADKLRDIYSKCPKGHHVDHIIPLNGENVCGLHVPENLQYLLPIENIRKSNKLTV